MQLDQKNFPLVSVGMPVFNGRKKAFNYSINIEKSLESLINQNYKNLEIIISDNCSNDGTDEIIKKFSKNDIRIKYFQQKKPITPGQNFDFVLKKSSGKYFKWNSHDDYISYDFISENVKFLEANKEFIFSSSPCCFDHETKNKIYKKFDFSSNQYSRIKNFFKIRSVSHSFFYGLIRRESLIREANMHPWAAEATDWILNLKLLFEGKFKTISNGEIVIGTSGASMTGDWVKYVKNKNKIIYKLLPYFELNKIIFKRIINSTELNFFNKIWLVYISLKINFAHFILYKLK